MTDLTLTKSTLDRLREEMRLREIKRRLKAALRRKPRPAKPKKEQEA
jgi:hypothetical protein